MAFLQWLKSVRFYSTQLLMQRLSSFPEQLKIGKILESLLSAVQPSVSVPYRQVPGKSSGRKGKWTGRGREGALGNPLPHPIRRQPETAPLRLWLIHKTQMLTCTWSTTRPRLGRRRSRRENTVSVTSTSLLPLPLILPRATAPASWHDCYQPSPVSQVLLPKIRQKKEHHLPFCSTDEHSTGQSLSLTYQVRKFGLTCNIYAF